MEFDESFPWKAFSVSIFLPMSHNPTHVRFVKEKRSGAGTAKAGVVVDVIQLGCLGLRRVAGTSDGMTDGEQTDRRRSAGRQATMSICWNIICSYSAAGRNDEKNPQSRLLVITSSHVKASIPNLLACHFTFTQHISP